MNKIFRNKVTVCCIFSLLANITPFNSMAGSAAGRVTQVMVHINDVVFFSLDGEHVNRPACSASPWSISLTTNTGRAMYALLLSAQAQNQRVTVSGTGDCSAWGDRETAHHIWIDS